ncbi:MAG TPA: hypothetical protein VK866_14860, partial [Acidimicrobiales bacterium]|nr:hypothetical protein [Acidimicrobiales bacterium]
MLLLEVAPGADASTEAALAVIVEATPVDVTLPGLDDLLELPEVAVEVDAPKSLSAPSADATPRIVDTFSGGDALRAEA